MKNKTNLIKIIIAAIASTENSRVQLNKMGGGPRKENEKQLLEETLKAPFKRIVESVDSWIEDHLKTFVENKLDTIIDARVQSILKGKKPPKRKAGDTDVTDQVVM